MKKIIIVLCVLVMSACGGGGKADGTNVDTSTNATISTIAPGTQDCITIEHPEGQREWTDIQKGKYGTYVDHHYKYKTVSCFIHN